MKHVYAIGFGFFDYFVPTQASILQKVSLQVLPVDRCEFSMHSPDKMCTYEHEKDSCISDSGGPLLCFIKGRQYVVGLISYGIGCGSIYPSVNTRVSSYLPWILNKTADEMLCRK
jgi:trypsin